MQALGMHGHDPMSINEKITSRHAFITDTTAVRVVFFQKKGKRSAIFL